MNKKEEKSNKSFVEISGIEPEASHMRSERSTTELYPHSQFVCYNIFKPYPFLQLKSFNNFTL